jgi:hypothetical protein
MASGRPAVSWPPKETDPDAWKKYVYPNEIDHSTQKPTTDPNSTFSYIALKQELSTLGNPKEYGGVYVNEESASKVPFPHTSPVRSIYIFISASKISPLTRSIILPRFLDIKH